MGRKDAIIKTVKTTFLPLSQAQLHSLQALLLSSCYSGRLFSVPSVRQWTGQDSVMVRTWSSLSSTTYTFPLPWQALSVRGSSFRNIYLVWCKSSTCYSMEQLLLLSAIFQLFLFPSLPLILSALKYIFTEVAPAWLMASALSWGRSILKAAGTICVQWRAVHALSSQRPPLQPLVTNTLTPVPNAPSRSPF